MGETESTTKNVAWKAIQGCSKDLRNRKDAYHQGTSNKRKKQKRKTWDLKKKSNLMLIGFLHE